MQTFLYKKEIDDINSSVYLKKDTLVTDALIENFYQEIMGKEEKVLMDLLLSSNPSNFTFCSEITSPCLFNNVAVSCFTFE